MWQLTPFESIGVIRFGQTRAEVRQAMALPHREFHKVPSANPTDDFKLAHVYYDDDGRVEFTEIFEPAQVIYKGVALIDRPMQTVVEELEAQDVSGEPDDVGMMYMDHGFVLIETSSGNRVDGVSVFPKGYYDFLNSA